MSIDHSVDIIKCLEDLYNNESFSDLEIEVEEEKFHVHSVVLASRAEYFRALLYGGLLESNKRKIKMSETEPDAFRRILKYIYSGKVEIIGLNLTELLDTFKLAHQYGFTSLSNEICETIKRHVSFKNISLLINFGILYDLEPLIDECLKIINSNSSKLLNSDHFFNLGRASIERVLTQDGFYAPEIEIFHALKWWLHNFEKENLRVIEDEKDPVKKAALIERIREECCAIMKNCIRLELIPMKFLLSEIRSSGYFESDKILDILTKQSKYTSKSNSDELRYRGIFLPGINLVNEASYMTIENNYTSDEYRQHSVPNERSDSLRLFSTINNDDTASKISTNSMTSILEDPQIEDGDQEAILITRSENIDTDNSAQQPSTSQNQDDDEDFEGSGTSSNNQSQTSQNLPKASATERNIHRESISTPSLSAIVVSNVIPRPPEAEVKRSKTGFIRAGSMSQMNSPKNRPVYNNNNFPLIFNNRILHPLSVGNFNMSRQDKRIFFNNNNNSLDSSNCLESSHNGKRNWMRHQISTDDYWQQASANITISLHKPSLVNTIKLRLWDKDLRSYSYYIDVSYDKIKWTKVADYRDYLCRSFQQIYFPTRVIQYIRIIGTKNTSSNYFHLSNVECMLVEKPQLSVNGFVCPSINVATLSQGATVLEGVSRDRNALISSHSKKYSWKWGYTCHQLGNGAIVVQLGQPYFVSSIRFLLYDHDKRSYGYTVEVFDGKTEWKMVCDKGAQKCQSWQVITFERQLVSLIKVIGKNNTADNVFHLIHLECPYIQAENDYYGEKMKASQAVAELSGTSNQTDLNNSLSNNTNLISNEEVNSQASVSGSLTPSLPMATDMTDGSMHLSTNSSFIE